MYILSNLSTSNKCDLLLLYHLFFYHFSPSHSRPIVRVSGKIIPIVSEVATVKPVDKVTITISYASMDDYSETTIRFSAFVLSVLYVSLIACIAYILYIYH